MRKVRVDLGERSYGIAIDAGSIGDVGNALKKFGFSRTLALVSNPTVYRLYGRLVSKSIKAAGFDLSEILIPDGEKYKSLVSSAHIYGELLRLRLDRRSAVVALGGGVIGDIAGFVASTYMRGIDFIQVPTTLLAQVDSSVGGKTGVNHELGKNMIGTFWQPRLVWIDVDTLSTLPSRELRAGLAEVIKYGIIHDERLFHFLGANRDKVLGLDRRALTHIIRRSCEIKAEVVSRDERESGLRAILNYGHTVGHAIETATGYRKFLHGEAVAIGMCQEALIGREMGLITDEEASRIRRLIESYGLPAAMPKGLDLRRLLEAMQLDKKTVSGRLRFVLPLRIGEVRIEKKVSDLLLKKLFTPTGRLR
ncbi:MAG: 3-dehydroquinate synthase [Nitrospiraceae bacterium]|nr:3-dehydroquinate synthase [Nitrospiraceae bacterium]